VHRWRRADGRAASGTVPVVDLTQAATWHRQAAALVAAADRVGVGAGDLPAVQQRLLVQRARLAEAVAAAGPPAPTLEPTAADIAAAMPGLGDLSPDAVTAALAAAEATLDAADSVLVPQRRAVPQPPPPAAVPTGVPAAPSATPPAAVAVRNRRDVTNWPPSTRNALVYGGYALAVVITQFILFNLFDETDLPKLAPCCLVVLPAFSWAAGWATIGLAFGGGGPGDPKVNRTPRLGLLINLIPNALLCAGVGVLFVVHQI
jgi:hypothetical protein